MADLNCVAGNFCVEREQELLGKCSGCDSRSRFAGRGTLEHVPCVVKVEFLRTSEVGVAWTRCDQFLAVGFESFRGLDRENLLPVHPVAILDAQRDRSANRLAVAHASEDLGAVLLNLLTATAAVAKLAPV